jgi:hypothetical protein
MHPVTCNASLDRREIALLIDTYLQTFERPIAIPGNLN